MSKCDIIEVARHRNGISGEPFYVIRFTYIAQNIHMVAIVFEEPKHIAVFDADLLGQGEIRFCYNSWAGVWFEAEMRQAIKRHEQANREEG